MSSSKKHFEHASRFAACVLTLSLLVILSSCSILTSEPAPERSLLSLSSKIECSAEAPSIAPGRSLLLLPLRASPLIASERMLYEKADTSLGSFQLAAWAEAPQTSIARIIQQQLECTQAFSVVTREQGLVHSELALATELSQFVFKAFPSPGVTSLSLRAELLDLSTRSVIAHKTFELTEPAAESSAQAAAQSFSLLVARLAQELSVWTLEHLPQDK